MFDRIFSGVRKGHKAQQARRAEMAGDLAKAAQLFAEADLPAEAARVMILRGDGEPEPRARLVHYTQAAATAPADHDVAREARKKRALLVLALAADGAVSEAVRQDLLGAAAELEAAGELESAAKAYARAGDTDSEARALAKAGNVDELEAVLFDQHAKEHEERKHREAHRELELLVASGRRREASALAKANARLADRAEQLLARRARGPIARVVLRGKALGLVVGDDVVIGRSEGAIQIASAAVSRRHLAIARDGGSIVVRDLGSRNGTLLVPRSAAGAARGGLAIAGAVPVGDGLDLRLGKEVPVRVAPSLELPGAVTIEVAGETYAAPLGPAALGIGAWRLELASDGWLELVTDDAPPAFAATMQLVARVSLLAGDAIAMERGGEAVLRIQ